MPFRVIQPPSDKEQFAETGKRIYTAAKELGIPLDPEGFLFSWVNGTRVLVEEQGDEIVGVALLAVGRRWTRSDTTASVLEVETKGDYNGMLEFIKQICTAFGCTEVFVQNRAAVREGNINKYTVIGHMLG